MVYHGPREDTLKFFEAQGFALPERKGIPDFLQEVCSKKDQEVIGPYFPGDLAAVGNVALVRYCHNSMKIFCSCTAAVVSMLSVTCQALELERWKDMDVMAA